MIGNVIKGLFRTRKPVDAGKLQEHLEELRGYISRDVKSGFVSHEDIIGNALDVLSDECDAEALRPHAERVLREEIEALQTAQRNWPEMTDYERLEQAFNNLEGQGIVCRQNFTCCGTCGSAEIWDEIDNAREQGKPVRGYAFFHMQDTESAVDGYGLHLNYGAVEEGEVPALDVARQIAREIAGSGLTIDWDGSWAKRIGVKLDWKRRLPA